MTIARNLLAEFDVDSLSLQESKYDNIFWLLMSGRRLDGLCFCCSCNCIISGSGGNVKRHASRHSCNSDVQTMEQKEQGFVLFMIRHNVGFTALRDPIIRVLFPGLTYARAQELCQAASDKVRRAITEEVRGISLCVMIDGWSDMSLRRYLGIGLSFFDDVTQRHVYRFLKLFGGEGWTRGGTTRICYSPNVGRNEHLTRSGDGSLLGLSERKHSTSGADGSDMVPVLLSPVESRLSSFPGPLPAALVRNHVEYQQVKKENSVG